MPVVEQVLADPSGYARIELALATTLPSAQAARVFGWLTTYPWRAVTWFGPGHSVRWYHEPATFPLGGDGGYGSVLLLDAPWRATAGGSHRTCPASPRPATRCGGSGSSRSRSRTTSWPGNTVRPALVGRLAAEQRS